MDAAQLAAVLAVFLMAGIVKGITGMGLPTVAMSLLGLWMPPAQAAALLVVPSLATNVAQCRGPHLRYLAARLWPGWLTLAAAIAIAPGIGDAWAHDSAHRWLGVVLVGYGMWGLWRPNLPNLSAHPRWAGAAAGAVTGIITAMTAVFVLPWVPFLQSLRLDKHAMVQGLGLSFTVATLALAARLGLSMPMGELSSSTVVAVCCALAAAFAGMQAGELLRRRLAGPTFHKALFLVLMALGVANLVRIE